MKKNYRASSPLVFKTVKEAELYWEDHFAGDYHDPDDSIAAMENWIAGVIIEEIEEDKMLDDDDELPSIARLQADAMSRGFSNYPPGFDESLLD